MTFILPSTICVDCRAHRARGRVLHVAIDIERRDGCCSALIDLAISVRALDRRDIGQDLRCFASDAVIGMLLQIAERLDVVLRGLRDDVVGDAVLGVQDRTCGVSWELPLRMFKSCRPRRARCSRPARPWCGPRPMLSTG